MWHEICTGFQEHKELIKNKEKQKSAYKYESDLGIPMSKSAKPMSIFDNAEKFHKRERELKDKKSTRNQAQGSYYSVNGRLVSPVSRYR